MTTYTAIANGEIDAESPITDLLLGRLRDNPIAIAEDDPTVPLSARTGHVLLGTLNTNSGTTHTLSGLNLTRYKLLFIVVSGVTTSASAQLTVGGANAGTVIPSIFSLMHLDLTGSGKFQQTRSGTNANAIDDHTMTTASTSISAVVSGANFTGGAIRIYGVK
jgi:hypothetical protein